MEEDPKEREVADKILEAIEKEYGFVPVVNQIMSTRPDLFIPQTRLSKAVFEGKGDLELKTRYLCCHRTECAPRSNHDHAEGR